MKKRGANRPPPVSERVKYSHSAVHTLWKFKQKLITLKDSYLKVKMKIYLFTADGMQQANIPFAAGSRNIISLYEFPKTSEMLNKVNAANFPS